MNCGGQQKEINYLRHRDRSNGRLFRCCLSTCISFQGLISSAIQSIIGVDQPLSNNALASDPPKTIITADPPKTEIPEIGSVRTAKSPRWFDNDDTRLFR